MIKELRKLSIVSLVRQQTRSRKKRCKFKPLTSIKPSNVGLTFLATFLQASTLISRKQKKLARIEQRKLLDVAKVPELPLEFT